MLTKVVLRVPPCQLLLLWTEGSSCSQMYVEHSKHSTVSMLSIAMVPELSNV
jgi:hypothetical protein